MAEQLALIPLKSIKKLQIYITNCKKTLSQVKLETGADYVLNGGMWNPNGTPCPILKTDGILRSKAPWKAYGIGWSKSNAEDISMIVDYSQYTNFITCTPLIVNGNKVKKLSYASAQGGTRGRTAFGFTKDSIVLYASQDGSSNAKSPEKLRDYLFNKNISNAIMLDSGGSSMCSFPSGKIKGDGRKVHNWILVYTSKTINKEGTILDTGNKIIEAYITNNPTYRSKVISNKTKIMLHSTGTPGAKALAFRNNMNSTSATTSVEFVIDDTGIYQLLPIGIKSWHCGGTANSAYIACEICEPIQTRVLEANWLVLKKGGKNNTVWAVTALQKELNARGFNPNGIDGSFGAGCEAALKAFQKANNLTVDGMCGPGTLKALQNRNGSYLNYSTYLSETNNYFTNVYNKAVWLFAEILKRVGGNANEILSHAEGYKKGIASNHADVGHWFPMHGKSMNDFRKDVAIAMGVYVPNDSNSDKNSDKNNDNKNNVSNVADWAKEAWDKATNLKIIDGTRPTDYITRQEVVVILNNLGLIK